MSFEQYINFRTTLGFVTDAAKTHGEISVTANYPATPIAGDSTAVGFTAAGTAHESRDRNAGNDPRIAGLHKLGSSSSATYRIDLPATGVYEVSVSAGDASGGVVTEIELFDNASSLGVLVSGTSSAAQRFKDATNTELTNVTWPSSATWVSKTFTSTIAIFKFGNGGATPNWNHVGIRQLTATPNITSVSTATPREGASLTITGTAFGASQGSGDVKINGVAQTVTSWSDTSIAVTIVLGTNKFGAAYTVVVRDNALTASNSYAGITGLLPANSGLSYVDIGTPNTTSAYRLTSTADLVSGDQVEYENKGSGVTVATDGTFTAAAGIASFSARAWTTGSGYGAAGVQLLINTGSLLMSNSHKNKRRRF